MLVGSEMVFAIDDRRRRLDGKVRNAPARSNEVSVRRRGTPMMSALRARMGLVVY
jgi:hypothetical protein